MHCSHIMDSNMDPGARSAAVTTTHISTNPGDEYDDIVGTGTYVTISLCTYLNQ